MRKSLTTALVALGFFGWVGFCQSASADSKDPGGRNTPQTQPGGASNDDGQRPGGRFFGRFGPGQGRPDQVTARTEARDSREAPRDLRDADIAELSRQVRELSGQMQQLQKLMTDQMTRNAVVRPNERESREGAQNARPHEGFGPRDGRGSEGRFAPQVRQHQNNVEPGRKMPFLQDERRGAATDRPQMDQRPLQRLREMAQQWLSGRRGQGFQGQMRSGQQGRQGQLRGGWMQQHAHTNARRPGPSYQNGRRGGNNFGPQGRGQAFGRLRDMAQRWMSNRRGSNSHDSARGGPQAHDGRGVGPSRGTGPMMRRGFEPQGRPDFRDGGRDGRDAGPMMRRGGESQGRPDFRDDGRDGRDGGRDNRDGWSGQWRHNEDR